MLALTSLSPHPIPSIPSPSPSPPMPLSLSLSLFLPLAVENWGMVTYRNTALLGNATFSSQSDLLRITLVIAHE